MVVAKDRKEGRERGREGGRKINFTSYLFVIKVI